ncbi:MAG: TIGR04076 family protein [Candidatus Bathyarchaeia archaeon]
MYRVTIDVKEIGGRCPVYAIGDRITLDGYCIDSRMSSNICMHAFSAMLTLLSAFAHGSSAIDLGIGEKEDVGYLQCPDPGPPYTNGGTVLFELRRKEIEA